jgi:hypothetical protein
MMHTCYNCNRPTGADYRIVGFDIGPDGIPVNLAFCADCRARGVVLATQPEETARPADLEEPEDDPYQLFARLWEKQPARVTPVVWLKLLGLMIDTAHNRRVVWYWDRHKSEWIAGAVIDENTSPELLPAP